MPTTTVTGFTATRMLAIENNSIVSGFVTGDDLILTKQGGGTVNAGSVRGKSLYVVTANVSNISAVAGMKVGDYIVNGDVVSRTLLGLSAAPGGVVLSTSTTAGTATGTFRGPDGATGPVAQVAQEAWHTVGGSGEPAFSGTWNNVAGSNYSLAGFKKDPAGMVRLKGIVKPVGAASGSTIFTLPVGYRPPTDLRFNVYQYTGAISSGIVVVGVNGVISASWSTTPSEVSLDGIEFDTTLLASYFPAGVATITQDVWHSVGSAGEPAFTNSWANSSAPALPLQFTKDPAGVVRVQGRIGTGSTGTSVFTLPVGYRPLRSTYNSALLDGAPAGGYITVNTDGTFFVERGTVPNAFVDISFPTAVGGAWPAGSVQPISTVSTLPSTPIDGQEVYFQSTAMATQGVRWHLIYRAASASAYKWEFLGGGVFSSQNTSGGTGSLSATTWSNAPTTQNDLTLPLAGDYEIEGEVMDKPVSAGQLSYGVAIGITAAPVFPLLTLNNPGANSDTKQQVGGTVTGLAAATVLRNRYYSSVAQATFIVNGSIIRATPIRVG